MNQQLLAVLDDSDGVVARFEYAGGRMPVAMVQGGEVYYLVYDQVGSLRAVYTAAGAVVRTVEYDAWGNILSESVAQDYEGLKVPFGFAGGLHDRDTGLVLFGLRTYDPETGRWTSRDPIGLAGGDTDLYAYCGNDPVNAVDPSGLAGSSGGMWGGGGSMIPFGLPSIDLTGWHYDRNSGLPSPPNDGSHLPTGWTLRTPDSSACHQFGEQIDRLNVVAEGPEGQEAVYSFSGRLVNSPENRGSYNYVSPDGLFGCVGHLCADVLPWLVLGNAREDGTSFAERCWAFLPPRNTFGGPDRYGLVDGISPDEWGLSRNWTEQSPPLNPTKIH